MCTLAKNNHLHLTFAQLSELIFTIFYDISYIAYNCLISPGHFWVKHLTGWYCKILIRSNMQRSVLAMFTDYRRCLHTINLSQVWRVLGHWIWKMWNMSLSSTVGARLPVVRMTINHVSFQHNYTHTSAHPTSIYIFRLFTVPSPADETWARTSETSVFDKQWGNLHLCNQSHMLVCSSSNSFWAPELQNYCLVVTL